MSEKTGAGAGGKSRKSGAEGIVASMQKGAVFWASGIKPAAITEEPVTGIPVP